MVWHDNDRSGAVMPPLAGGSSAKSRGADRDLARARGIPDEFLQLAGDPRDRVISIVTQHWDGYDATAQAELAQALLPVLVDLDNQAEDAIGPHRGLCEAVVATWLRRQQERQNRAG
jgi:hypothetical protein